MKIGILTYYGVHNYGALLQANALKKVLSSMGHDCVFPTFTRNYDYTSIENINKYKIGFKSIPFYLKYLVNKGLKNIVFNLKKADATKKFTKENIPLAKRYSDFESDVAIIGSDEVFSTDVGINPFFYGHGIKCKKVLSYAGSFGSTSINLIKSQKLQNLISSGFQNMDAISVRDENSQSIIYKLTKNKPTIVCDPVILYGYKDEMNLLKPKIKNYIVVYSYDKNMNNSEETSVIRSFAKENKLKIVSVGNYHKWCDCNIVGSPIEMITWIKNAKYVITDTFHGTVVSLICNTPMIVKVRNNSFKLDFLLKEYCITDRTLFNFNQLSEIASKKIDFELVNSIIETKRKISYEFLKKELGETI